MRGRSNGAIEYGSLPAAAGDSSVTGCELGVEEGRRPVGRVAPRPPNVRSAMALIILLVACSNLRSRSETNGPASARSQQAHYWRWTYRNRWRS